MAHELWSLGIHIFLRFSAFQNDIQIAHLVDTNGMDEVSSAGRQGQHKQRLIISMSNIHFTPNIHCKNLLLADGVEERKIFSVGSPLLESGKNHFRKRLFHIEDKGFFFGIRKNGAALRW